MQADLQEARKDKRIVIIGGGPGGSTLAIRLAKLGYRPTIVERSEFPREHIGESLTGECGLSLVELGFRPQLEQADFPIKRGVLVHGSSGRGKFFVPVQQMKPDGTIMLGETWQVRRPDFDKMLLDRARDDGAKVIRAEARDVIRDGARVAGVRIRHNSGEEAELQADFVADASGLQTFLSKVGVCGQRHRGGYEKQVAFYLQVEGAVRDPAPDDGNTHIFYSEKHRWAWLIPISSTVTSVGIVVPGADFKKSGQSVRDFLMARLHDLHPSLALRMQDARPLSDVWTTSNYSYEVEDFAGPGYLCVGDAHQFTDPIFSFGVSNSLKEASIAAPAIDEYLLSSPEKGTSIMRGYMAKVGGGQSRAKNLIDTFWEFPLVFLKLAHVDMKNDIAELFSGRIYDEKVEELGAVKVMNKLMEKHRAMPSEAFA